jgi:hypothetical protein
MFGKEDTECEEKGEPTTTTNGRQRLTPDGTVLAFWVHAATRPSVTHRITFKSKQE